MDTLPAPHYGEIWQGVLDPTVGHEQAGVRPVIIVSVDLFNGNPSRILLAVPVARRDRGNPFHVPIAPSAGGLRHPSFALCDAIRSISAERLQYRIGAVSQPELDLIKDRLGVLLGLPVEGNLLSG